MIAFLNPAKAGLTQGTHHVRTEGALSSKLNLASLPPWLCLEIKGAKPETAHSGLFDGK